MPNSANANDILFNAWAMNNEDSETTSTFIPAVSVIIKQDRNQVLKKHVEVICVLNCIQCDYKSTTKDCVKKHGDAIHEGVF